MNTTPTNTRRTAEFDAQLVAYRPTLRKLAARYVPPQYREDLVADTIVYCLDHSNSFRADGAFRTWVRWCMWTVVREQAQRAARRKSMVMVPYEDEYQGAIVEAGQEHYADLSIIVGKIPDTRNGKALLRRAMGEDLAEIGADMGIGRERVRQLVELERTKLRKRTRVAA